MPICRLVHRSDDDQKLSRLRRCCVFSAGSGAGQEESSLADVLGERGGAFELDTGLIEAIEFDQEVATDTGQEVIRLQ